VLRSARGVLFLPPLLFAETMACTPDRLGLRFDIPIVFLQGEQDVHTLPELAQGYLEAIDAPAKRFVLMPGTGHIGLLARPEQFLEQLRTHVLPWASAAGQERRPT
jgi:pimeloyl-ACP methyl ester carboxylesterase